MGREWVISARFMSTICHFTCLLISFSTYEGNVQAGISDNASDSDENTARSTAKVITSNKTIAHLLIHGVILICVYM